MRVMSFNVNGIRARAHQIPGILAEFQPDILGLQETKILDDIFPEELFGEAGYQVAYHGQKGHYGVAIAARTPMANVRKGFPGDEDDAQRRLIAADFPRPDGSVLTLINGYFPQGSDRQHAVKFPAKDKFYRDLTAHLATDFDPRRQLIVLGDFNIAPEDRDVAIGEQNAKRWLQTGKCSFLPEEREWFAKLVDWGLADCYRRIHREDAERMSWFDFRSRGFDDDPKRGLRIDLIMATAPLWQRCVDAGIDYDWRGSERPSDHCAVWADFD